MGTLWFRTDGAMTYLPDPDQSRGDESPAYVHFRDQLLEGGHTLDWQTTYNAGANPLSICMRTEDLQDPPVQELLAATFAAVKPGATKWWQRLDQHVDHPEAP
jgi:hypothetical protein